MCQLIVAIHVLLVMSQIGLRDTKLLFLQSIFCHGDRSPYHQYTGDPTPPDFWPEGYGMLTKLGRKQHYALGKYLKQLYKDFITSNPNEVLVNSTNMDRCCSSALTHLAPLYAPETQWKFDDDFNWQPIPIHSQPFEKDKRKYNRTLPFWAELFYNQLEEYSQIAIFELYDSALMQKLRAGPILSKIIENMNKKIAGDIPNLKVQVFSSQYYHLVVIMKALRVFNDLPCPYCATLLFELHELLDGSKAVRMMYLNSTTPQHGYQVPHVLTMEGCFEYCPLDFFINYTKHLIPQDWEKECGLT